MPFELQSSGFSYDLTEELEIIVETLPPFHEHVQELAGQPSNIVKEWQLIGDKLEPLGARIAGFEPGLLEWHGVVDGSCNVFMVSRRRGY